MNPLYISKCLGLHAAKSELLLVLHTLIQAFFCTLDTVLLFDYVAGAMDSANLDEMRVDEPIIEKMKDLQIHRREKIYAYSVEEIKFLGILKSKP